MPWEIPFEKFALGAESTRGTAVTPPTEYFNLQGMITPQEEQYYPPDSIGVLAEYDRSEMVRQWAEFQGDGALDPLRMPRLAFMALNGAANTPTDMSTGLLSFSIASGGTNYAAGTTATLSGGAGTQATVQPIITGGVITGFVILTPGAYSSAPTTIAYANQGSGSGASTSITGATLAASGSAARLWTFLRQMTSDNLQSTTNYWGDPNQTKLLQGAYGMVDELGLSSGAASGTDGSTLSVKGHTRFPAQVTPPAFPAVALGPVIVPMRLQLWIDTGSNPYGGTPVTGRVVSVEHTIPTGVTYKYPASGPAGTITYDHVGRQKTHPVTKIVVEMIDLAQYTLFEQATQVKLRARHNATLIDNGLYSFVQVDGTGKFTGLNWADLEGSNRTMELEIAHEYDATLATDLRMQIQTTRTTVSVP